ncbi:NAD(P)/FAD-dependent oxidoreductase [Bermanella sp. WJH001]|uniref:NAD(P)/FAD-dependent oxidoreductase n=1 Tax=Bermanella sp. WJH001 TaxID=3048005 RepID=UPI0024BEF735|nr:NAD(P)/FAD-dependent oxidoreductase [Bermanella sp. WJH001]MDJ1539719.1 NAD(P)/FAD-dependent oxidoreductase [Bermanella sp. WJH001]
MKNIVIVGGGAGGLELATKLGDTFGKRNHANIHLVDANNTHLWKPLLHEVATGSLDSGIDELSYRAQAYNHYFHFHIGRMNNLDRDKKEIILAPIYDENKVEVLPERHLQYDTLVLAIGSQTNDFGTKGAKEFCSFLDSRAQADKFHQKLLNTYLKANNTASQKGNYKLNIAIVGAGATGVELAAELHNTASELSAYGLDQLTADQLQVIIIEAGDRILPALPPRISTAAHRELEKLNIQVKTNTFVQEVTEDGFITNDGHTIAAELKIWAAGVKAPDWMKELSGLETNRANQIIVKPSLQTTLDDDIFAIGDCSFMLQKDGTPVPPRAQAAHQQAYHVYKNLVRISEARTPKDYVYKDKGSLVNLSRYSTVGSLMGNLSSGSMMVEGKIARIVYVSLYRLHQVALHGYFKTALMSLSGRINKIIRPRLKLH